jgi:hypothetical protein
MARWRYLWEEKSGSMEKEGERGMAVGEGQEMEVGRGQRLRVDEREEIGNRRRRRGSKGLVAMEADGVVDGSYNCSLHSEDKSQYKGEVPWC